MSLKKRIAYFVCAACMLALAFPAFGFTLSGEAKLGRDGKASVRLTIVSELNETDFREKLDSFVTAYCNDSSQKAGDTNAVVINDVKKTGDGYIVTAVTRRIDKVTVSGTMDYSPAAEYAVPDSMERRSLRNWMRGNYGTVTVTSIKGSVRDSVTIGKASEAGTSRAKAIARDINGREYDNEKDVADDQVDFYAAGNDVGVFEDIAKSDKNTKVVKFFFLDIGGVTDATVTFDGKIRYYGGNNATLVDAHTVKFESCKVTASIISTADPDVGSVTRDDVTMLAGWAVVDNGTSPFAIALAVIAAVAVGGGIIAFIIHVNNLGKKAIAKEEDKQ